MAKNSNYISAKESRARGFDWQAHTEREREILCC